MKRRALLLALAPLRATAQPASPHVVGYLHWGPRPNGGERDGVLHVLLKRLAELGHVEGRHIAIDARYADGHEDDLQVLAKALVTAQPKLIVVRNAGVAKVVLQHTRTLPVVALVAGQLEAEPMVRSLATPGGNLTGMQLHSPELIGKRLQLLRDVVPGLRRVVVLRGVAFDGPGYDLYQRATDAAAAHLGIVPRYVQFGSAADLRSLLGSLGHTGEQAVLIWGNPHLNAHRPLIAELALKHRVPVLYDLRYPGSPRDEFMVYGPLVDEVVREAAGHVDKILRGADPAELPIGRAKSFELVVNRTTARALGLALPRELILRADEVIE